MFIPQAYAQSAAGAASGGGAGAAIASFAPLLLIMVAFYFIMIRPQQTRANQLRRAIDEVKKGDQVVTAGGIRGKVTRVDGDEVEVEIAANTRVRVVKATLAEVIAPNSKPAND